MRSFDGGTGHPLRQDEPRVFAVARRAVQTNSGATTVAVAAAAVPVEVAVEVAVEVPVEVAVAAGAGPAVDVASAGLVRAWSSSAGAHPATRITRKAPVSRVLAPVTAPSLLSRGPPGPVPGASRRFRDF